MEENAGRRRSEVSRDATSGRVGPVRKVRTAGKADGRIIGRRLGVHHRAAGRRGMIEQNTQIAAQEGSGDGRHRQGEQQKDAEPGRRPEP